MTTKDAYLQKMLFSKLQKSIQSCGFGSTEAVHCNAFREILTDEPFCDRCHA